MATKKPDYRVQNSKGKMFGVVAALATTALGAYYMTYFHNPKSRSNVQVESPLNSPKEDKGLVQRLNETENDVSTFLQYNPIKDKEFSYDDFNAIMGSRLKDYSPEDRKDYYDKLRPEERKSLCIAYSLNSLARFELSKQELKDIEDYSQKLPIKEFVELSVKYPWLNKNDLKFGDKLMIYFNAVENDKAPLRFDIN